MTWFDPSRIVAGGTFGYVKIEQRSRDKNVNAAAAPPGSGQ
jgi:hypothetical protein